MSWPVVCSRCLVCCGVSDSDCSQYPPISRNLSIIMFMHIAANLACVCWCNSMHVCPALVWDAIGDCGVRYQCMHVCPALVWDAMGDCGVRHQCMHVCIVTFHHFHRAAVLDACQYELSRSVTLECTYKTTSGYRQVYTFQQLQISQPAIHKSN
jgi:hypothetical protein